MLWDPSTLICAGMHTSSAMLGGCTWLLSRTVFSCSGPRCSLLGVKHSGHLPTPTHAHKVLVGPDPSPSSLGNEMLSTPFHPQLTSYTVFLYELSTLSFLCWWIFRMAPNFSSHQVCSKHLVPLSFCFCVSVARGRL